MNGNGVEQTGAPSTSAQVDHPQETQETQETQGTPVRIYIILHSPAGHVHALAKSLQEGAQSVPGVEVSMFKVPETPSSNELFKAHAPPPSDIPDITADQLKQADGFLFGVATHYGNMSSKMMTFWDTTVRLWQHGRLDKKMAGMFFSTGSPHGGQETTAITFLATLIQHGIIYVPLGWRDEFSNLQEVFGSSAYGAGTFAGDGNRSVHTKELKLAKEQGEEFATILSSYVYGRRHMGNQHFSQIGAHTARSSAEGGDSREATTENPKRLPQMKTGTTRSGSKLGHRLSNAMKRLSQH